MFKGRQSPGRLPIRGEGEAADEAGHVPHVPDVHPGHVAVGPVEGVGHLAGGHGGAVGVHGHAADVVVVALGERAGRAQG